jgi:branched-chain amino acid aminotransferase
MQWVYFNGKFVPPEQAKVSIQTHAFNYGTAIFEGMRAYFNAEKKKLFGFRWEAHFRRMEAGCRVLKIKLPQPGADLIDHTKELLRANDCREDVYIRPLAYKAREGLGPRLTEQDGFAIYVLPFPSVPNPRPWSVCISSYRRIPGFAVPAGVKITGAYVNAALATTEAKEKGFDEAILLDKDGFVCEGSAMNLFLVTGGKLITPPLTTDILGGVTRDCIMTLAKDELDVSIEERAIAPQELFAADEVFFCGTGVEVVPISSVDRRAVGDGKPGSVTGRLAALYLQVVRSEKEKYQKWLAEV